MVEDSFARGVGASARGWLLLTDQRICGVNGVGRPGPRVRASTRAHRGEQRELTVTLVADQLVGVWSRERSACEGRHRPGYRREGFDSTWSAKHPRILAEEQTGTH
jgi:hypothetical protein